MTTEIENLIAKQDRPATVQSLLKTFHEVLEEAQFTQDWQLTKIEDQFGQCLLKAGQQKPTEFLEPLKVWMQRMQKLPAPKVGSEATIMDENHKRGGNMEDKSGSVMSQVLLVTFLKVSNQKSAEKRKTVVGDTTRGEIPEKLHATLEFIDESTNITSVGVLSPGKSRPKNGVLEATLRLLREKQKLSNIIAFFQNANGIRSQINGWLG